MRVIMPYIFIVNIFTDVNIKNNSSKRSQIKVPTFEPCCLDRTPTTALKTKLLFLNFYYFFTVYAYVLDKSTIDNKIFMILSNNIKSTNSNTNI